MKTRKITIYILQCNKCSKDIAYRLNPFGYGAFCSVECATGIVKEKG